MEGANLDADLEEALKVSFNVCVPWFLCTSVLYYRQEISILSDIRFDKLCHQMLEYPWKTVRHVHKRFVKPSMLTAGTGFDLPWAKLPGIVYGACYDMKQRLAVLQLETETQ